MSESRRDARRTPSARTMVGASPVWPSDERGSVTVLVVLAITGLLALLALGIDLGGLFNARSEAQRAADAAALAGASAFLEYQESKAQSEATARAVEFATSNEIRNRPIAAEEVSVWVSLDSATVRARVRRDGVPTWFARLFGIDAVDIGAEATAWAGEAGAATCVKPFAVPDMWDETNDDLNHNRIWDAGEHWKYDPASGDRYAGYSGPGSSGNETGYGSGWRDGQLDNSGGRYTRDYGRRITVKPTDPHDAYVPSFFLPWVLPADADQGSCHAGPGNGGGGNGGGGNGGGGGGETGGGSTEPNTGNGTPGWLRWTEKREDLGNAAGSGPRGESTGSGTDGSASGGGSGTGGGSGRGAARYRQNICSCNSSIIDLDSEYEVEPGNMVGPTYQGVRELIERDPDAYWDERTNEVVSEYGMDSPRVVTVALFDPGTINKPGRQNIRFNNFARIFIEEQDSPQDPVTGRFLYYVPGIGRGRAGETTGSLVRVLQLIR